MNSNNQVVGQSNTGESIAVNHIKALVASLFLGSLGGAIIWALQPALIKLPPLVNAVILIVLALGLVYTQSKFLANKAMSFKWLYYLLNVICYIFILWISLSLLILFLNFIFIVPGVKFPF